MASSPLRSKSNYHARSVSLPSRLHPVVSYVDEHFGLSGLESMYDRLDNLLLLPHTQQAFAQQRHEEWVEVVLEKYLRLLDVCATAKDLTSQTKQDLQCLLSILRRRREANDFSGFLNSRKQAKKVIQKSQKDLKSIKMKQTINALGKSREILDLLNEVEAATIGVFDSLLSNISGTKAESRLSAFSLASKFMHRKTIESKNEETNTNVFEKFDTAFHSLNNHTTRKSDNTVCIENVPNQLGKMELIIQEIEERLEFSKTWNKYVYFYSIKTKHSVTALGKSQEILDFLNEVEAATFGVLEALLSYISRTKEESRLSGFSLASKLLYRKSVASKDEETNANVFEKFNAALHSLNNHKTRKSDNTVCIESVSKQLGKMELSIQEIEEGLECWFRRLIKTRVTLLSILNH
ncbi:hypothetical protein Vadar_002904 [Vaccinium darrowii]|uniref:Uncharacterized protein n=1 Tax=Vaccinium darrowii TaxID=229202 RepID=A0ACB7YB95_9ERIC|nr:hypothetical protein Vadar_002904 [Vaccinium darrowii]